MTLYIFFFFVFYLLRNRRTDSNRTHTLQVYTMDQLIVNVGVNGFLLSSTGRERTRITPSRAAMARGQGGDDTCAFIYISPPSRSRHSFLP